MMNRRSSFVESSRMGVLIFSAFAFVWAIAAFGLSSVPQTVTVIALVIVGLFAVIMNAIAASRRFAPADETKARIPPHRRRTIFIASNIGQAVLFSTLISVCVALNELAYIPLVGSFIVGAHLIPIGLSFGEQLFVAGGSLLMLMGAGGTAASWMHLTTSAYAAGVVSLTNAVALLCLAGLQISLQSTPTKSASRL